MTPTTTNAPIIYDAASVNRILGLPCECNDPVPEAKDGEIVIYYGGWDLPTLRTSDAGKERMWQDLDWYDRYEWEAKAGYYRLLLPVPQSNHKIWDEQVAHLRRIDEAWRPAPVCVAATALLVHLTETGHDLLKNDWCRCAEPLLHDNHAGLTVDDGRVYVYYGGWGGSRSGGHRWLSASRKS